MASIRKRGDFQWEARIRWKGWPVTCTPFNTKRDAKDSSLALHYLRGLYKAITANAKMNKQSGGNDNINICNADSGVDFLTAKNHGIRRATTKNTIYLSNIFL